MDIISIITDLVATIFQAAGDFMETPERLDLLEENLQEASRKSCAEILAEILTDYDRFLSELPKRKKRYKIERHDSRTLITTFGDVRFTHTYYRDEAEKRYVYLLDEKMHLNKDEHFSELAEAELLDEAAKSSYQRAADAFAKDDQTVTKVTVMNKVHGILENYPDPTPDKKRSVKYLYIEADEDHIHRQKAGTTIAGDCIIGKLIYLHEGVREECTGRNALIRPQYFGGRYAGSEENGKLWEEVAAYIRAHYDMKTLRRIYISGDGGAWIRKGTDVVPKSIFVADRFHLMKYINAASRQMLDDCNEVKGCFYKYIYKNKPRKIRKLIRRMLHSASNPRPVEQCGTFLEKNWDAIQAAFHDRHVIGCSAEGHVSHIYSDRMSSRPMGWSETGADRMCRLRCLINNEDRKIIDIVRYRREKTYQELRGTGTDDISADVKTVKRTYTKAQLEAAAYAERIHASFAGDLHRKQIAIKLNINI